METNAARRSRFEGHLFDRARSMVVKRLSILEHAQPDRGVAQPIRIVMIG
jgi:hypothetical protein